MRERGHGPVGPLGHGGGNPAVDLFPPVHLTEHVLDIVGVLGEEVGPIAPLPRFGTSSGRLHEVVVRSLQLFPAPLVRHDLRIHSLIVTLRSVPRSMKAVISLIIWVTWAFITSRSPSAP